MSSAEILDNGAPRESAAERAYAHLRTAILDGTYAQGVRLPETEVASALGVSRTPVREALRRLVAEGLVVASPNQGVVVAGFSDRDLQDIFALRGMLESYGAACAAERATPDEIEAMRKLAHEIQAEAAGQAPGYLKRIIDMNGRFHRAVIDAARNERLAAMFVNLIEMPIVARSFNTYTHADLLRSAAHHVEIVQAIAARDTEWAASTMRSHVRAAAHLFEQRSKT